MEKRIISLKNLSGFADDFIKKLTPHGNEATVVALHGDLGAGKTSFTQAAASALGVEEHVTSPTFVIEKIYKLNNQTFEHLIHIDAYRLESGEELKMLGWDELAKEPSNLIFIEWAERVEDLIPQSAIHIFFTTVNETERSVTIKESHD